MTRSTSQQLAVVVNQRMLLLLALATKMKTTSLPVSGQCINWFSSRPISVFNSVLIELIQPAKQRVIISRHSTYLRYTNSIIIIIIIINHPQLWSHAMTVLMCCLFNLRLLFSGVGRGHLNDFDAQKLISHFIDRKLITIWIILMIFF